MPAFWRDADRSAVPVQEAVGEWALVAWDVLEGVAGRWRRTLTEDDLGAEVQRRSGIVTSMPTASWMGPLLSLVAQRAHESHGPALTSLVVGPDGRVGEHFREALALRGTSAFDAADLDEHAREAQAACNRAYEAKEPASRTGRAPRVRPAAARPAKPTPAAPRVCPSCFLQLPATGVCDDCS